MPHVPTARDSGRFAGATRTRADIEGLRAIAVLAVVLHHTFPRAIPGGFAGVDIFFVISGYLIGEHLLEDIQASRFSIREFYARRARRIFPALVFVLLLVWAIGWVVFSAPEYAALGRQIAAATLFSNNILLWSESGYFDVAAEQKPLLHLWSLGIEEQFYLLVPILLWVSRRGGLGSIRWVARLGMLSLLTTIFLGTLEYTSTFYLLHTRFWELACGVALGQAELRLAAWTASHETCTFPSKRYRWETILFSIALVFFALLQFGMGGALPRKDAILTYTASALVVIVGVSGAILADVGARHDAWSKFLFWFQRNRVRLTTASSIGGILLCCGSIAALNSDTWPGIPTVFPVFGTALLIAAGRNTAPNKVLALKPLVFLGGISYPLYLWHWPALVLWRQMSPEGGAAMVAAPLAASFFLAWLTKVVVEDPIRFGKLGSARLGPPSLFPVISGMVVIGFLGLGIFAAGGLPSRFSPKLRAIAEWSETNPDAEWRAGRCYFYTGTVSKFSSECTPAKRPGVPLVLLWGDSHAANLYPGLNNIRSSLHFDIVQWTSAGCPPTVTAMVGEPRTCPGMRADALKRLTEIQPDLALLGGAWERYQELGRSPDEILALVDETIRYLKRQGVQRIVIFGPGPLWATSLPVDLFRYMARERTDLVPERLGKVSDSTWQLDAAMARQAAAENVRYVSVVHQFCDRSGCLIVGDQRLLRPDLLFRDRDHLTVSGSRFLIGRSKDQLFGGS